MSGLAIALALLLGGVQSTDPVADGARTGSRLDPATRPLANSDKGNRDATMYRFIECAVARRGSRVRRLIDTRSEPEYQRGLDALSGVQRCNIDAYVDTDASMISFGSDRGTLRGIVAEAFLANAPNKAAALAPLPLQRVYARDWFGMTGRVRQVDEMAACVADTNPGEIVRLLATAIGSKDERRTILALAPTLGPCLSTGFKLSANTLGMRTALAEALYHRLYDTLPVTGKPR